MHSQVRESKTVANALRVLVYLRGREEGGGVTELSRQLGLGKSTVHLLLSTLARHDFVEVDPLTARYRLGLQAFEVGAAAVEHRHLGARLTVPMERLAHDSGEAVSLAVASGSHALIVQRVESAQLLRAEIKVGTRMPLHASASGKCLLAHMSRPQIDQLYPEDHLPSWLSTAVSRKSHLLVELEAIRRCGFAVNREEFVIGITAIAAVVRDGSDRALAALSIAGPTARFDERRWLQPLLQVAEEVSALAAAR